MNVIADSTTPQPTDDRHARRKSRTRAALLEAGRTVLTRLGYQATTVADITREADVGVGTFYLHFRDKDALLHTLLETGLDELHEEIAAVVATVPLARSLPTAIHALCDALFTHRDLFRIAYTSGIFLSLNQRGQGMLATYLMCAIEAAQAEGLVGDDIDAPLVAGLVSGMILQGTMWWFDHTTPLPAPMADQIIRLLRGGLPAVLFDA